MKILSNNDLKCNWLNHEDRGGYVPGEAINIWATIDNQSKVTIKGTRASLTEVGTVQPEQGHH